MPEWRGGPPWRGGEKPDWWPQGEPWPPPAGFWRRRRRTFALRAAGALAALLALCAAGCVGIAVLVAIVDGPPPTARTVDRIRVEPWRFSAFPLMAAGGLAVLGIVFFATRAAFPAADWIEAAGRVEAGDFSAQVPDKGPREVRSVARAFNAMTSRLKSDEERRRATLADVTHELRTPLTVLQGQIEGMIDGVYPADDTHLAAALSETRVLSRLIDDLRTLSLSEAGALPLQREPLDVPTLLADVASGFAPAAAKAGVDLRAAEGDPLPTVSADPVRIREVVSNLVANALRHTPEGGSVELRAQQAGNAIRVSVQDSGVGIPADALPHVFDRFYRAGDSGGSGLGLTIARSLVRAHGGDIWVESTPGSGATVIFTLPTTG